MVLATVNGLYKTVSQSGNAVYLRMMRGATELMTATGFGYTGTSTALYPGSGVVNWLDSPNTTSSTTYKIQFRNEISGDGVYVQANNSTSVILLLEIGA